MHSLLKVVVSLAAVAFVFLVFGRRPNFNEDIGWKRPRPLWLLAWILIGVTYMLATDAVMDWRGPWDWEPWRKGSVGAGALRVLAVAVIGPIAEELIMRGLLQSGLARRLPLAWAILIPAALWAAIHFDYSIGVQVLFFGFGIQLGLARLKTGSIWTAIAMHWIWNIYAIW